MNYSKIYDNIIKNSKNRILEEDVYKENHHIVPKCMGGTNNRENLVELTAREHFLCHKLLCKIYTNHYGLAYSLQLMTLSNKHQNRYIPSSQEYERIRINSIEMMTEYKRMNPPKGDKNGMYGRNHTEETKLKMSIIRKKRKGYKHSFETRYKIALGNTGKIVSGESRKKMSISKKGKLHTIETKKKMSELHKNNPSFLGKKHTAETKEKMSNQRKGTQQGNDNPNAKSLIDNITGIIYGSRKEYAEKNKLSLYKVLKLLKTGVLMNF